MDNGPDLLLSASCERILAAQNRDGGWGYRGGASWTEPTAYALMAIAGESAADVERRGRAWLATNQRKDGGFAPRPSVSESTWVTALALIAGLDRAPEQRAVAWMAGQTGQETTLVHRIRQWMLGNQPLKTESAAGWPWYPGTAAWVTPTSLTLLALRKIARRYPGNDIRRRLDEGPRFLMSRRCEDGGWNHGSSRALGFQAVSYPETTGIALLALHGEPAAALEKSFARAEEHFARCRSAEGQAWLQLGLLAHGRKISDAPSPMPGRTLLDSALTVLAARARSGRNVFLEEAA